MKVWPWRMLCYVPEEWHVPCTLKPSCSFRTIRRFVTTRRWTFRHTFIFILFQWRSTDVAPLVPNLPHFCMVYIYLWTCSRPENVWNICQWTLLNQQLINYLRRLICQSSITSCMYLKCANFLMVTAVLFQLVWK